MRTIIILTVICLLLMSGCGGPEIPNLQEQFDKEMTEYGYWHNLDNYIKDNCKNFSIYYYEFNDEDKYSEITENYNGSEELLKKYEHVSWSGEDATRIKDGKTVGIWCEDFETLKNEFDKTYFVELNPRK